MPDDVPASTPSIGATLLLGVTLAALGCADEAPSTAAGSCAPFGYRCTHATPSAWWSNAVFTPRIRTGAALDSCHASTIRCHYLYSPAAGLQRDLVDCHAAYDRAEAGIHLRLRFRAPFYELPAGRVLRLGEDFSIERLYELGIDPVNTRPYLRFDARAPVVGALTLTVLGPPRHIGTSVVATLPYVRVEGQLCGAPLNVMFRGETVEIDFL